MNEKKSLLPEEIKRDPLSGGPYFGYGFFGYRGAMCDRAIRADNADMLAECLERDFFDPDSELVTFKTVRQFCKEIAPRCFAMLEEKAPVTA